MQELRTLIVQPINARLTRSTSKFSKMDPFIIAKAGNVVQRTRIAKG
jgi:hypothetical protein